MSHATQTDTIEIFHPKRDHGDPRVEPIRPNFVAQGTYSNPSSLRAYLKRRGSGDEKGAERLVVNGKTWNFYFSKVLPGNYDLHVEGDGKKASSWVLVGGPLRPIDELAIYYPLNGESTPPHPTPYGSSDDDRVYVQFIGEGTSSNEYPEDPAEIEPDSGFWSVNIADVELTDERTGVPTYTCKAAASPGLSSAVETTGVKVGTMMG
jgi:hypothetical protein